MASRVVQERRKEQQQQQQQQQQGDDAVKGLDALIDFNAATSEEDGPPQPTITPDLRHKQPSSATAAAASGGSGGDNNDNNDNDDNDDNNNFVPSIVQRSMSTVSNNADGSILTQEMEEETSQITSPSRWPSKAAEEEEFKVVPLQFNITTYNLDPSISPRNDVRIPIKMNQPFQVELDNYLDAHPEIEKLVSLIHSEVLRNRPEDIVEYLWMDFFRENNHNRLRKAIRLDD